MSDTVKRNVPLQFGPSEQSLGSSFRAMLRSLRHEPVACIGLTITALFALGALLGPWIVPDSAIGVDISHRLLAPRSGEGSGLLGTDAVGRDVLGLLISGSRTSFMVCFGVVGIAVVSGTLVGVMAGYRGGWFDTLISRYIEIQGAFPALLLCLLVLAVVTPSVTSVIVILAIERWPYYVRVARGTTLAVKHRTYVEAAGLIGCPPMRVILRHVLPGVIPSTLSLAVLDLAHAILAESTLSFLGFGAQPPTISWGLMIDEGQDYIFDAWWLVLFPGATLAITVIGLNLTGNWVQRWMTPHAHQGRHTLQLASTLEGGTRVG